MGPILGLPGLPHLGVSQRAQHYCRIYELQWRASWRTGAPQRISAITLGKSQVLDDGGGLTAVVILSFFFFLSSFYNFWLWLIRAEK